MSIAVRGGVVTAVASQKIEYPINGGVTTRGGVNKIVRRSMDERMPRRDDVPRQPDEEGPADDDDGGEASIFYCRFIIEAKTYIRLS